MRQNCLLVLTHLLLNDMIKPKEYVSEVSQQIIFMLFNELSAQISQATLDPQEEIRALAERFFFEMAQKGDQLYNLMPDVTSRLSEDAINNVLMPFGVYYFCALRAHNDCELYRHTLWCGGIQSSNALPVRFRHKGETLRFAYGQDVSSYGRR